MKKIGSPIGVAVLPVPKFQKGLTLIETLVALVIVALAFSALIFSMIHAERQERFLEEKIVSHWVGLQTLRFVQSGMVSGESLQDNAEFKTQMLNKAWYWRTQKHILSESRCYLLSVKVGTTPDFETSITQHQGLVCPD